MEINTNETPMLLEEWAKWSRINGFSVTGYPSLFNKSKGDIYLAITDAEALKVDSAVARLICKDREMGSILKTYYFNGCNLTTTSKLKKITRERARVLVKCGESWVDAKLEERMVA